MSRPSPTTGRRRGHRVRATARQERLGATLRSHEEMTALVAHDLRNPLSVVLLTARMLKGASPVELEMMSGRLRSAGLRMLRIIDQLSELSESRLLGGLALRRQPIALRALIERIVDQHCLVHPMGVDLSIVDELQGSWDETRLEQLVANLLDTGARTCAGRGRVALVVSASHSAAQLTLTHPVGLTAAEVAQCFAPFSGARRGTQAGPAAISLGLYIAQQIALAHGGQTTIQSSAADGTTISISLPFA